MAKSNGFQMHNSNLMVKRRRSQRLHVKMSLPVEFGRLISSPPLLTSSHPCHLSPTQPCRDAEHDHSQQRAGCSDGFMWAQLNQQLTRAVESNKNHNVYIIALPRLPHAPVEGVGCR